MWVSCGVQSIIVVMNLASLKETHIGETMGLFICCSTCHFATILKKYALYYFPFRSPTAMLMD